MIRLDVKSNNCEPFSFQMDTKEVRVGRGSRCDLILPDPKVSRDHALFVQRPEGVFLKDLGSFNGTFVNGRRIYEIVLKDHDQIILGTSEILFLSDREETVVTSNKILAPPEPLEQTMAVHPSGPLDRTITVPRGEQFDQTVTVPRPIPGPTTEPNPSPTPLVLNELQTIIQKIHPVPDNKKEPEETFLLKIKPPTGTSFSYPIEESEILIGRSSQCHLTLNDQLLSRKHALVRKTPEGLLLEDQNSANGTYVNDQRITSRTLEAGDRIRLGVSLLTVERAESGPETEGIIRPGKAPTAFRQKAFDFEPFSPLFGREKALNILIAHPDSFRISHLLSPLKQAGAVLHDVARKEAVLSFVLNSPPDLILLSPGLNRSLDLCLELRDQKSEVPILILMEELEWEEVLPFIKAGADDVLLKDEPYELFLKLQKLVELYRLRRGIIGTKPDRAAAPASTQEKAETAVPTQKEPKKAPELGKEVKTDFLLLLASRASTRIGDGFLRIISILLVAAKSKDPMVAGLVLVFRYVCEILINAISGPFIDKIRIRNSLMASDLLRTVLSLMMIGAVLLEFSYAVYLVLSFLGDFVFIFFKPASDKMVKVSFPVKEGTKVLSRVDAVNHISNIGGYALASVVAGWMGLQVAVFLGPVFFFLSFLMVSRLRLGGESIIDYTKVRKKSYWASQREGLKYTWGNKPLRLLLMGRSLVAVGRGSFTVLSVVYLANIAKGLTAYGYFESAQSAGKVVVTALVIPLLFAYRSTFFLTALSLIIIGLAFFGFTQVNTVVMACLVGALVGAGQASEAVGIDAILNRYSEAHIQGRAKSTTSFGSRVFGLTAIGVVYLLVTAFHVPPQTLFGWLGIFPFIGAMVFFKGWKAEKEQVMNPSMIRGEHVHG
ncbi:MAG: MFS transporter [Thermodesulfobacteriota bacterium]